jgi:hypothetical protein
MLTLYLHVGSERRDFGANPTPIPLHLGSTRRSVPRKHRQIQRRVDINHDNFVRRIRINGIIEWERCRVIIEGRIEGK